MPLAPARSLARLPSLERHAFPKDTQVFHKQLTISFVALLPTSLLFAQVDPAPRPQATTAQTAPSKDRGSAATDAILVTWLLTGNSNEIALARLAQQKAQSNEVKQFAQKMIDDHGQLAQK